LDDDSKQLVLNIVARAHDCAFSVLVPHLAGATPGQRAAVEATVTQFLGYVQDRHAGEWEADDLPRHLRTLIDAQTDLPTVQLLRQYSEYLNYFLVYAAERLGRPLGSQDN